MRKKQNPGQCIYTYLFWTLGLLSIIVTACSPAATSIPQTPDMSAALTQAMNTAQAALVTPSPLPTNTSAPTPTLPPRTPPALPGIFQTTELNPLDVPQTYIQESCQYFQSKWSSNNSAPGTVVMVIMFHSITSGEVTNADQISAEDHIRLMNDLKEQGFEAITTQQLADFLYTNAYIPPRSVLLIVDDRKYRQYFDTHFYPYWQEWGWPVVNAWISHPETLEVVWQENAEVEAEGWVDHQAHGVIHNYNMSNDSTDEFLQGELQGSIDAIQQRFNKTPIAIIWPGGGFAARPVVAARQYGFQLGFTINPRGPVMFNWIPQASQTDAMRPSYIPEGSIGDPLMTLPRYWDTDARQHIDSVRRIGKEAAAYAEQNKAIELEYYDIVCAPTYGPIP